MLEAYRIFIATNVFTNLLVYLDSWFGNIKLNFSTFIMKKAFILCFLFITTISAHAQLLDETFDASCEASPFPGIPAGWEEITVPYNQSVNAYLQWNCTPYGEYNTPGMLCTGIINNTLYLDTAYLFTPVIHLSNISGPLYFQFDAKY